MKLIPILFTVLVAAGIFFYLETTKLQQNSQTPKTSKTPKVPEVPKIPIPKPSEIPEIPEKNMEGCQSLDIGSNCITSQVRYNNYTILSTCLQCDCQKYGHEFLYLDLNTNQIEKIQVERFEATKLYGTSMSIKNRRLFIVDKINNTVLNFDIIHSMRGPILSYSYQMKANILFKLGWVYALSEYEILVTAENFTQRGNESTSSIFYVMHSPSSKKQRSEVVEGIENSKLFSGIVESKHHKFIVGSPDENSVIYFKYFWIQGIGFKFTKENTTEVGVRVGTIAYDEKNDQALFTKNAEHYPEYYCSGTLKAVGQNHNDSYETISQEELFQAQKTICSMDSVLVYEGVYYLGSSNDNKYLVCKK